MTEPKFFKTEITRHPELFFIMKFLQYRKKEILSYVLMLIKRRFIRSKRL